MEVENVSKKILDMLKIIANLNGTKSNDKRTNEIVISKLYLSNDKEQRIFDDLITSKRTTSSASSSV
jgi:hypothetical protein